MSRQGNRDGVISQQAALPHSHARSSGPGTRGGRGGGRAGRGGSYQDKGYGNKAPDDRPQAYGNQQQSSGPSTPSASTEASGSGQRSFADTLKSGGASGSYSAAVAVASGAPAAPSATTLQFGDFDFDTNEINEEAPPKAAAGQELAQGRKSYGPRPDKQAFVHEANKPGRQPHPQLHKQQLASHQPTPQAIPPQNQGYPNTYTRPQFVQQPPGGGRGQTYLQPQQPVQAYQGAANPAFMPAFGAAQYSQYPQYGISYPQQGYGFVQPNYPQQIVYSTPQYAMPYQMHPQQQQQQPAVPPNRPPSKALQIIDPATKEPIDPQKSAELNSPTMTAGSGFGGKGPRPNSFGRGHVRPNMEYKAVSQGAPRPHQPPGKPAQQLGMQPGNQPPPPPPKEADRSHQKPAHAKPGAAGPGSEERRPLPAAASAQAPGGTAHSATERAAAPVADAVAAIAAPPGAVHPPAAATGPHGEESEASATSTALLDAAAEWVTMERQPSAAQPMPPPAAEPIHAPEAVSVPEAPAAVPEAPVAVLSEAQAAAAAAGEGRTPTPSGEISHGSWGSAEAGFDHADLEALEQQAPNGELQHSLQDDASSSTAVAEDAGVAANPEPESAPVAAPVAVPAPDAQPAVAAIAVELEAVSPPAADSASEATSAAPPAVEAAELELEAPAAAAEAVAEEAALEAAPAPPPPPPPPPPPVEQTEPAAPAPAAQEDSPAEQPSHALSAHALVMEEEVEDVEAETAEVPQAEHAVPPAPAAELTPQAAAPTPAPAPEPEPVSDPAPAAAEAVAPEPEVPEAGDAADESAATLVMNGGAGAPGAMVAAGKEGTAAAELEAEGGESAALSQNGQDGTAAEEGEVEGQEEDEEEDDNEEEEGASEETGEVPKKGQPVLAVSVPDTAVASASSPSPAATTPGGGAWRRGGDDTALITEAVENAKKAAMAAMAEKPESPRSPKNAPQSTKQKRKMALAKANSVAEKKADMIDVFRVEKKDSLTPGGLPSAASPTGTSAGADTAAVPSRLAQAPRVDTADEEEEEDWETKADESDAETRTPAARQQQQQQLDPANDRKRYSRDFMMKFVTNNEPLEVDFGSLGLDEIRADSNRRGMGRAPSSGRLSERLEADRWGGGRGPPVPDPRAFPGPPGAGPSGRAGPGAVPVRGDSRRNVGAGGGLESDRWQQRGPPQGQGRGQPPPPRPALHKSQNRYQVGQVDTEDPEEEKKQKVFKGALNKLTPENFDKLMGVILDVEIKEPKTLVGLIDLVFDKALGEPHFCEMYAQLCQQISKKLPEFDDDTAEPTPDGKKRTVNFRRLLLNKCQEEFEKGSAAMDAVTAREKKDKEDAQEGKKDKPVAAVAEVEEGEITEEEKMTRQEEAKMAEEERKARWRMLGNIQFIGHLYQVGMLTEKIMHACIQKLLADVDAPKTEDVECLCKLMSTIGGQLDKVRTTGRGAGGKEMMEMYFGRIKRMAELTSLESRIRFMMIDVIELRARHWEVRRVKEGPKKIQEVHREARLAMAGGGGGGRDHDRDRDRGGDRGDRRGGGDRGGPPLDPLPPHSGPPPFDRSASGPAGRVESPSWNLSSATSRQSSGELQLRPSGGGFKGFSPARQRSSEPRVQEEPRGLSSLGPGPSQRFGPSSVPAGPPRAPPPAPAAAVAPRPPAMPEEEVRKTVANMVREFMEVYKAGGEEPRAEGAAALQTELKKLREGGADMALVLERAVMAALDTRGLQMEERIGPLQPLFQEAVSSRFMSPDDVSGGLVRLVERLPDLDEDNPKAVEAVARWAGPFVAGGTPPLAVLVRAVLAAGLPEEDSDEPCLVDRGVAPNFLLWVVASVQESAGEGAARRVWQEANIDFEKLMMPHERGSDKDRLDYFEKRGVRFLL